MRIVNDRGLIIINTCKELFPDIEVEVVYIEGEPNIVSYLVEPETKTTPTRLIINTRSHIATEMLSLGLARIIAEKTNQSEGFVYNKIADLYNIRIKEVKDKYSKYFESHQVRPNITLN